MQSSAHTICIDVLHASSPTICMHGLLSENLLGLCTQLHLVTCCSYISLLCLHMIRRTETFRLNDCLCDIPLWSDWKGIYRLIWGHANAMSLISAQWITATLNYSNIVGRYITRLKWAAMMSWNRPSYAKHDSSNIWFSSLTDDNLQDAENLLCRAITFRLDLFWV